MLDRGFRNLGVEQLNENYFDTVHIRHELCNKLYEELLKENMVLRKINDNELVINLDETTRIKDVNKILSYTENLFNLHFKNTSNNFEIDKNLLRTSNFMEQDLFKKYNSETELLRYIHKLAEKDYTLCDGMIPLGS